MDPYKHVQIKTFCSCWSIISSARWHFKGLANMLMKMICLKYLKWLVAVWPPSHFQKCVCSHCEFRWPWLCEKCDTIKLMKWTSESLLYIMILLTCFFLLTRTTIHFSNSIFQTCFFETVFVSNKSVKTLCKIFLMCSLTASNSNVLLQHSFVQVYA